MGTLIPYMMLAVAPRVLMTARMAGFRALSTSAVARKDIVQETYLRELKAYKAPEKAPDAHKGHVREFSSPAQPQAPPRPRRRISPRSSRHTRRRSPMLSRPACLRTWRRS